MAREGQQGCRDGLSSLRLVGQPEEADGEAHPCPGRIQEEEESGPRAFGGPTQSPAQGLEPGAAALMRRCCCCDSALQRCLHLFCFSIIKTQAATQPDSPALGDERTWAVMARLAERSD